MSDPNDDRSRSLNPEDEHFNDPSNPIHDDDDE